MVADGLLKREEIKLLVGHCGWHDQQLRSEVERHVWFHCRPEAQEQKEQQEEERQDEERVDIRGGSYDEVNAANTSTLSAGQSWTRHEKPAVDGENSPFQDAHVSSGLGVGVALRGARTFEGLLWPGGQTLSELEAAPEPLRPQVFADLVYAQSLAQLGPEHAELSLLPSEHGVLYSTVASAFEEKQAEVARRIKGMSGTEGADAAPSAPYI